MQQYKTEINGIENNSEKLFPFFKCAKMKGEEREVNIRIHFCITFGKLM